MLTELFYKTVPYYRFGRYYLIRRGFQRRFATDADSQQRTVTPPDTMSCPIWDCICSNDETIPS